MQGHYHLAGIAGVGMSALGEALAASGAAVSGSDRHHDQGRSLAVLDRLVAQGVRLFPQDGSGLHSETRALVLSTAVEADNPEIAAARRLGVPVRHRTEVLAELIGSRTLLAVAGTCGKTTVTAMLGWTLEQLGADPFVINGGALVGWMDERHTGSVRAGAGPMVIEADESDRSFLRFTPEWAIITNISKDHFELDEVVRLFREFAGRVRRGVIAGPEAATILAGALPEERLEGLPPLMSVPSEAGGVAFEHEGERYTVPMIGRHNAENARAVVALCLRMGFAPAAIRRALAGFRGVSRRLERVGAGRGVTVLDDYAHNPEKIRAAWQAAAAVSNGRVFGLWRPHGFGPLRLMMDELSAMWRETMRTGDRLYLLPVYYAGGTAGGAVNSGPLAERLQKDGRDARFVADYMGVDREILAEVRAGDVVLVMGARDPELPIFARRVAAGLAS